MRKWIILLLLLPVLFCGCAGVQTQIAKFDDQNAARMLASGKQVMKHWLMNSKAIHIGVGDEIIGTKLPAGFGKALTRLDEMAKSFGSNQDIMTEADATEAVMQVGKLITPAIQAIINQYAPDVWSQVMKYLPSFLAM